MSTPPFTQEKASDGKVRGQQPTLLGAVMVKYENTRLDGRRTQHVGILGSQWTAHDRGVGDKGVPAAAIIKRSTTWFEAKASTD